MSTIEDKFQLPSRHVPIRCRLWAEYNQLAATYNPINLGIGFPDYQPSKTLPKALAEIAAYGESSLHQYTSSFGHPRLARALSHFYSKLVGRDIDSRTQILTTMGAYGALYLTISAHVDVGDEVIVVEPFFDCYEVMIRAAGGIPRFIRLRLKDFSGQTPTSADWILDHDELECLFNHKTKVVLLNNPHNPTGKVFGLEELQHMSDLCKKWNVLCISDEVYEWMVYKPHKHLRMCALPGMWDRTLTICSAGKTFGITGWRLGWVYGPSHLLSNVKVIHTYCNYTGNTPIQEAVAVVFEKLLTDQDDYLNTLTAELQSKRDFLVSCLDSAGLKPTAPEGGCLILADLSSLESRVDLSGESDERKDFRLTKWMTKNLGVQGIPLSAMYGEDAKSVPENFVRFCFFKKDETLMAAGEILSKWERSHSKN